jgi:hypothetical protein
MASETGGAAGEPAFFLRPVRQAAGLVGGPAGERARRPLAPLRAGPGPAQARHRSHPRGSGGARQPPHRHRAGLRHRRGRDGAVVAAGPRGVDLLAWESFGEGWVTDVAKQLKLADARVLKADYGGCPISRRSISRPRRGVHLERHHLGRAGARRDWIAADAAGPHHLRRHLGGLRQDADLGQARCHHLLLAEGARRRGGARHAGAVAARRGAAGKLCRRPGRCRRSSAHQGRQAQSRHLRGRDHQHPLDAVRGGLDLRARMGGIDRRACRR